MVFPISFGTVVGTASGTDGGSGVGGTSVMEGAKEVVPNEGIVVSTLPEGGAVMVTLGHARE